MSPRRKQEPEPAKAAFGDDPQRYLRTEERWMTEMARRLAPFMTNPHLDRDAIRANLANLGVMVGDVDLRVYGFNIDAVIQRADELAGPRPCRMCGTMITRGSICANY